MPILLEVREGALWRIDRKVREIRAAQALQLRVEVGEIPPLEQGIIGEVNTRRYVLRAERNLPD